MDEHPFGAVEPGTAVKHRDFNPTAGYEPHGVKRFVRTDTGKWHRIDHIQREQQDKEQTMTPPTAVLTPPAPVAPVGPMSVYDCIVAVSQEMAQTGIQKNRSNAQQNYKFRGIDDVLNALSPLLAKYRLVILPRIISRSVVERETRNGGVLFYVTVEAEFDFVSATDRSVHTVKTYGEAMDSADKATNKAMSAAYKYAAFQTFCIPTEGDNDADAMTHDIRPRAQAPTQQAAQVTSKDAHAAQLPPGDGAPSTRVVPSGGVSGHLSDDGPDLGTADPEEMPAGFDLIRDYKLDGDWHQIWWGGDGSNGYTLYKTKIAKIGLEAHNAFTERHPVRLHSKKPPYLDRVETLGMTGKQLAGTKFQHDDPAFCNQCGAPVDICRCH